MKYAVSELEKALKTIKEHGGPTEVSISVDPMHRLIISYVDPYGEDAVVIKLFDCEIQKMATITRTERL